MECLAAGSLTLDVRGFDNWPPLFDLGFVISGKRLGRLSVARRQLLPEVNESCSHGGIGQGVDHCRIELGDNILRSAFGSP